MFDLFIFSAHRAQARQNENKRGRYPRTRLLTLLMKRGTTWTPAGGEKWEYAQGTEDCCMLEYNSVSENEELE